VETGARAADDGVDVSLIESADLLLTTFTAMFVVMTDGGGSSSTGTPPGPGDSFVTHLSQIQPDDMK